MTLNLLQRRALAVAAALSLAGAALAVAAPGAEAARPQSTAVLDWNAEAGRAAVIACISPTTDAPHESRIVRMASLAVHDALNAIDRRSEFYAPPLPGARLGVVGRRRRGRVARHPDPGFAGRDRALRALPGRRSRRGGVVLRGQGRGDPGRTGQDRRLQRRPPGRRGDRRTAGSRRVGHPARLRLPRGHHPGAYRFTPGSPFAFAPDWGNVTPFAIRSATQFQSDAAAAADQRQVRARSQRGQGLRRRRRHHPLTSFPVADRGRTLLVGELTADVGLDRPHPQPRASSRPVEPGRGSWPCSTSPSPTATSRSWPRSTTTSSGVRSPRSDWPTRTATPRPRPTRPGRRSRSPPPSPTTRPVTGIRRVVGDGGGDLERCPGRGRPWSRGCRPGRPV